MPTDNTAYETSLKELLDTMQELIDASAADIATDLGLVEASLLQLQAAMLAAGVAAGITFKDLTEGATLFTAAGKAEGDELDLLARQMDNALQEMMKLEQEEAQRLSPATLALVKDFKDLAEQADEYRNGILGTTQAIDDAAEAMQTLADKINDIGKAIEEIGGGEGGGPGGATKGEGEKSFVDKLVDDLKEKLEEKLKNQLSEGFTSLISSTTAGGETAAVAETEAAGVASEGLLSSALLPVFIVGMSAAVVDHFIPENKATGEKVTWKNWVNEITDGLGLGKHLGNGDTVNDHDVKLTYNDGLQRQINRIGESLWSGVGENTPLARKRLDPKGHDLYDALVAEQSEINSLGITKYDLLEIIDPLNKKFGTRKESNQELFDLLRMHGFDLPFYIESAFHKQQESATKTNAETKDNTKTESKFSHKTKTPAHTEKHPALDNAQNTVSGQQVKNYTVTITNLVKEFTVNTNSVKEAVPDIKRAVLGALTDALNDVQINN